jgi:hypothetical protein
MMLYYIQLVILYYYLPGAGNTPLNIIYSVKKDNNLPSDN